MTLQTNEATAWLAHGALCLKRSFCMGALATAAGLTACGAPPPDLTATTSAAIQGGSDDTEHDFAVGIVETGGAQSNTVAFCSGVLLAPNLVATARHCVADLTSTTIDCSTSTFGALYPASDLYVTAQPTISMHGLVRASKVIVPSGASQTSVCGNDIALVILAQNINLPQYVEPIIDPPMTDPQYEPTVTAIGYGVDTPTDTQGLSAGTRRIIKNVPLLCIPNDTSYADCFADPSARSVLTAGEFVSGNSTCEGDSGSGAYEQGSFDKGVWKAFGVLSRGGVSANGLMCAQPIYTRFDAWGPLIVNAAQEAARAASPAYALAAWAGGVDNDAGSSTQSCQANCGDAGLQGTASVDKSSAGCAVSTAGPAESTGEMAVLALGAAAMLIRRGRRALTVRTVRAVRARHR